MQGNFAFLLSVYTLHVIYYVKSIRHGKKKSNS